MSLSNCVLYHSGGCLYNRDRQRVIGFVTAAAPFVGAALAFYLGYRVGHDNGFLKGMKKGTYKELNDYD